jgi:hypothetical protein
LHTQSETALLPAGELECGGQAPHKPKVIVRILLRETDAREIQTSNLRSYTARNERVDTSGATGAARTFIHASFPTC